VKTVAFSKNKMKRIVKFGKRKFRCELKKVRVSGKQEGYTKKRFLHGN